MISKKNKIKLAKMLKLVAEVITDKGILYSDTDLIVGEEVFIFDENDDLIPASDGEYAGDKLVYVVAEGKIIEIREFVNAETTETQPVEGEEKQETTEEKMEEEKAEGEEEKPAEEEKEPEQSVEDLKKIIADKDQEIADLQKQIEEIKSANKEVVDLKDKQISDLEATIAEYKDKEGKSTEEPIEETEQKMSRQEQGKKNVIELLKKAKH